MNDIVEKEMKIKREIEIAYGQQIEKIENDKINKVDLSVEPIVSYLMCTYNDVSLLRHAISSLLRQERNDWELIVLDNSDRSDEPWKILESMMETDSRIYAIKNKGNIGWAKGASVCLKHARGKYISFLAADDCITSDALKKLDTIIEEQSPDIIWVGNSYVKYFNKIAKQLAHCVTENKVYHREKRSEAIVHIFETVYYNSFFHYVKKSLLEKYKIDFYYPYFGDCAGMTKALTVAENMVILDEIIYLLTVNTSQTMGYYIWDSYKFIFASQWENIIEVFYKEGYFDIEGIKIIAKRIERNHIGIIKDLIRGNCRNRLMNKIQKSITERVIQVKDTLENHSILEMMEYYGRKAYYKNLEEIFALIYPELSNITEKNWLSYLIEYGYEIVEGEFRKKKYITKESMEYLILAISCEENYAFIGFEFVIDMIEYIEDGIFYSLKNQIGYMIQNYQIYVELQLKKLWRNYIEEERLQTIYQMAFYGYCKILYQDISNTSDKELQMIGNKIESFLLKIKQKEMDYQNDSE